MSAFQRRKSHNAFALLCFVGEDVEELSFLIRSDGVFINVSINNK